jgi:hypothetical protein
MGIEKAHMWAQTDAGKNAVGTGLVVSHLLPNSLKKSSKE